MNLRQATLHQLVLFEAVVRHGSFTAAARQVHLTQPAVSIQIKRLEQTVGVPLLEQVGKRTFPTDAGKLVHQAALDIQSRLDTLAESIDGLRGEIGGALRICAVSSATYFMPHLLRAFLDRHPRVEPRLHVTNRDAVYRSLSENADDVFVMGSVHTEIEVERHPFLENVLGVVAPADHPRANDAAIPLEEIAQERFLVRERGSGSRRAIERRFREHGVRVEPYMELDGDEAVKQAVLAGLGVAALSLHTLHLEIEHGKLVVLDVEGFPLRRRWHVVTRSGRQASRATEAFVSFLQAEGESRVGALLRRVGDAISAPNETGS